MTPGAFLYQATFSVTIMIGKALVLGSLAFDYIMNSPEHYFDALSIKNATREVQGTFLSIKKVVNFGGTAGNIAYNMARLGGSPVVVGTVGPDFETMGYRAHLASAGVDLRLTRIEDDSSASCYIFNDVANNQISVFHGGALNRACEIDLGTTISKEDGITIAINAPNNMSAMAKFAVQLKAMSIPFIFDPGQVLNALTPEQFKIIMENASAFISNEHELAAVHKRFGIDMRKAGDGLDWIITTKGGEGSVIHRRGQETTIQAIKGCKVVDPTGAGDAFRGALLAGLTRGLDVETSARLGSVAGSMNVEHGGGQSPLDKAEFARRYEETFKETCPLP